MAWTSRSGSRPRRAPERAPSQAMSSDACYLGEYYRQRAAEYDEVYRKPERQADLARLRQLLPPLVAGKRVLEIAAGTGYWTEVLARLGGRHHGDRPERRDDRDRRAARLRRGRRPTADR